jgi:electron-transferring-flavoprotein dehydrogenase
MDVDIVCVGFGPATAGFLTTLSKSPDLPPLQILCYERAEDIGFGVSGVVTRARGIRASLPDLDPAQIPMAAPVASEKLVYLRDPARARNAVELPYIPPFLCKQDGLVMSLGQFLQYAGGQVMATGAVQIWPGMPVEEAIVENGKVCGVRLKDQGVDREGNPDAGYMPGMDVRAALTVVGDGPVGAVGRQLADCPAQEWAVGMKMVVDLPESNTLPAGTVLHTFGYPEPEIYGFLYVHPGNVASVGIFVPSWMQAPGRTAYEYLQYFMLHPYLWRHLKGGRLRSWGAKSLNESGRAAEPLLAGDGFARIGEGSGSTNVLTGSGVDEAWTTGVLLAEGVLDLIREGKPFTRENLQAAYVARRRASWVESEARVAEHARDGFHYGMIPGLLGMALAGFTGGRFALRSKPRPMGDAQPHAKQWSEIPYDGQLLVSHQDALLMGGKVQAPGGYADHVRFLDPEVCARCGFKRCIQMCSGQAITAGDGPVPAFDREKCVHCGACLWNCRHGALAFQAGAGGLHSSEN